MSAVQPESEARVTRDITEYPNRNPFFRRLTQEERQQFRNAGRHDADHEARDTSGLHQFIVSFYHHPEYRIGALELLLSIAKAEAELVNTKAFEPAVEEG